ncbi:penicillin-binding transpeptidase domain-containing protein [Anaerocolumna sp. AGMB13020]|uniref:penicillin-binding transpeptidase domain-containing protein n=1 Tax=Anaerocolumna sp. AGMB13020 TaxID=3081750 RepID=UPI0029543E5E|nr:penicillin-binding transpeptidase domain-containing protein [Anaerocolumna sp. AGMB13020]WOO34630.1 penicillin-binding transpeptidase domain-containing protein [Anaerocolumna sp. AGMB13020]
MKSKSENLRLIPIAAIFLFLILWLITVLYQLQILKENDLNTGIYTKKKEILVNSTRGNIYDRNGLLLAGNRTAYFVTLEDNTEYDSSRERQLALNGTASGLIKIFRKNGETLENTLPIALNANSEYIFTTDGTRLNRLRADIFGKTSPDKLTKKEAGTGSEELSQYLCNKFGIYEDMLDIYTEAELNQYGLSSRYEKEELLQLLGIRYMLWQNSSQKFIPLTLARDVSEQTVADILENSSVLKGVQIDTGSIRVYEGGEAFSNIIGYTGNISSEELDKTKEAGKDYTINSIVGKDGIEKYMEEDLKGSNGTKEVAINQAGRIQDILSVTDPVPGKDVYLSLDYHLQTAAYQLLEQHIAGILLDNLIDAVDFNKTGLSDSSDIRIPVYDVYYAFIKNNLLQLSSNETTDLSPLEKEISERLQRKLKEILKNLTSVSETAIPFNALSKECQLYEAYLADILFTEASPFLLPDISPKKSDLWLQWEEGTLSFMELLLAAVKADWINTSTLTRDQKYLDAKEAALLLAEKAANTLTADTEFHKLVYQQMLKTNLITPLEICQLLYLQGVLKEDEDYKRLINNELSPYSFIRKKIQNLEITPAQLALEPCSGSVVVTEAVTGKLLACVTYPGYDNNLLSGQESGTYYSYLLKDLSLPLYNRATQQLTAPGSTFKPITIAAGLEEKVITPATSVFCDGVFDKRSPHLRCWKRSGHGIIENPAKAIQNSCNDYLCEISYRLGSKDNNTYSEEQALKELKKYANLFHLDSKSGIEINESLPQVTNNYAIPSSIGQGTHNYTTVQLAAYVNILAEKGTAYRLSLLDKIADSSTGTESSFLPETKEKVQLSQSSWDTLTQGMLQYAQNNTLLKDMDVSVSGKTGTAQESKTKPNHALFIGYAPSDTPEISIAVRIANGYYSSNAVGVAKDVITCYFKPEEAAALLNGKAISNTAQRTD